LAIVDAVARPSTAMAPPGVDCARRYGEQTGRLPTGAGNNTSPAGGAGVSHVGPSPAAPPRERPTTEARNCSVARDCIASIYVPPDRLPDARVQVEEPACRYRTKRRRSGWRVRALTAAWRLARRLVRAHRSSRQPTRGSALQVSARHRRASDSACRPGMALLTITSAARTSVCRVQRRHSRGPTRGGDPG
jgi:hypothetical protein